MPGQKLLKTPFTRVWTQENGAGPANAPAYQGLARAGAVAWPQGDLTRIEVPSDEAYGGFVVADIIKGAKGLASLPLEFRMTQSLSAVLKLVKKGCIADVQVHAGSCKAPTDFNRGWSDGKVLVLKQANATSYGTDPLGALESGQNSNVIETVPFSGLDYFEIGPVLGTNVNAAGVTDEIVDVVNCDSVTCGACGLPSDGCQIWFALQKDSSGSPGIGGAVHYTKDGGATWAKSAIASMAIGQTPYALACMGAYLVVVAQDGHHYVSIADLLAGVGIWTKVTTGYTLASGEPRAITVGDAQHAWIAATGGYVYFLSDPTAGVAVQTAGNVTTQALAAIHALDINNVVAIGASNATIRTQNGGSTWSAVTGPAPAVSLNTVWVMYEMTWLIGSAAGNLYYTRDGGITWVTKTFPGAGAGSVRSLSFSNTSVGYMSHEVTPGNPGGRVLRTIDGGYSWYVLPEGVGTIPANWLINAVEACGDDVNIAFAGGLAQDGNDGVLIKLA